MIPIKEIRIKRKNIYFYLGIIMASSLILAIVMYLMNSNKNVNNWKEKTPETLENGKTIDFSNFVFSVEGKITFKMAKQNNIISAIQKTNFNDDDKIFPNTQQINYKFDFLKKTMTLLTLKNKIKIIFYYRNDLKLSKIELYNYIVGNNPSITDLFYNDKGLLIKSVDNGLRTITEYLYLPFKNMVMKIDSSSKRIDTTYIIFNSSGELIKEYWYSKNLGLKFITDNIYDGLGQIVKSISYSGNNIDSYDKRTYYKNGLLKGIITYNESNKQTKVDYFEYKYIGK